MTLIKVAPVGGIPPGEMKKFDIGELEITVANVDGKLYAFSDRCPHMNSPLHLGALNGKEVVCPFHKAHFDVTTGKKVAEPRIAIPKVLKLGSLMAGIRTNNLIRYSIEVIEGEIFIKA